LASSPQNNGSSSGADNAGNTATTGGNGGGGIVIVRTTNEDAITASNGGTVGENTNHQNLNQISTACINVQQNNNSSNTITNDGNNSQVPFEGPTFSAAAEQQVRGFSIISDGVYCCILCHDM
jgi:hypothetical protein